ncbi:MAG: cryptochrome/photolyase family protein [Saprospiraceae bacterium]|nr:cryptochrome/photolyase family protein [Saprospiraceae bacterium]
MDIKSNTILTTWIVFPHHLSGKWQHLANVSHVFLTEEYLFFNQYRFHKQKLVFHRASMKAYEQFLKEKNLKVEYIDNQDIRSDIRQLMVSLSEKGYQHIHTFDPCDDLLEKRITESADKCGLSLTIHESPLFINTREDLATYGKLKKSYFQTDFYIYQRKKRGILTDAAGQPLYGKWSFDADNRKPYPKGKKTPLLPSSENSQFVTEATNYVNQLFSDNPGNLPFFIPYPVRFTDAQTWFEDFLHHRFSEFGVYEDAMVDTENVLHHSVLSPLLNVGLLDPNEVISQAIEYSQQHNIPFNSLEGFVRQILGWREFIRYEYIREGRKQRTKNFWGFDKPLSDTFYTGETGIEPLDKTIHKVLESSYNHHIERLMILSNFMLLTERNPDSVYQWFMEMYIDAYDWVMVPNVYGMGQFSDGGLMCTKPYISGSNYIIKMSNYKKNAPWTEIWDALFWRFLFVHRDVLKKNPRLAMLITTFDKWPEDKKSKYLDKANQYLKNLEYEKTVEPA